MSLWKSFLRLFKPARPLEVGQRRLVLRSPQPSWVGRELTILGPGEYDGWDVEVEIELEDGPAKYDVGGRWLVEHTRLLEDE